MMKNIFLIFIFLMTVFSAFALEEETIKGETDEQSSIIEVIRSPEFETYFTFAAISFVFLAFMWISYSSKNKRRSY